MLKLHYKTKHIMIKLIIHKIISSQKATEASRARKVSQSRPTVNGKSV